MNVKSSYLPIQLCRIVHTTLENSLQFTCLATDSLETWVQTCFITLSLPFVKSGTGASLGPSISVDPASPRLQVILLV